MINVLFDTSPLKNDHAIRGVGVYTRQLETELRKMDQLNVFDDVRKNAKPDIVHYPFFDLFFSTLPIRLTRKSKIVVTVHDVIPLLFPKYYKAGIKGRLRFFKQRTALQRVDAVLTDSYASQADIIKYLKIKPEKVHVTYLAANPEIVRPTLQCIADTRKKYHIPKKYILYVGDINYNKNLPQLIKSLKFLPDEVTLVCVGKNFVEQKIPEWTRIEQQLALSDVSDRVCFLPQVTGDAHKELAALYSGAACYVQPSLYEGFGLPVLEAMQCKTPVVASNNSSLIEVSGKHAVMVEATAESIAEGIKQILSWSELQCKEHVEKAFKWSQEFSWSKTAVQTFKVYQQLMK